MAKKKPEAKPVDIDALIAEAKNRKFKAVFVPSPQALGRTYDEIVASLDKLADAELPLYIVPTNHRGGGAGA